LTENVRHKTYFRSKELDSSGFVIKKKVYNCMLIVMKIDFTQETWEGR